VRRIVEEEIVYQSTDGLLMGQMRALLDQHDIPCYLRSPGGLLSTYGIQSLGAGLFEAQSLMVAKQDSARARELIDSIMPA
jgi:hypothetical protein